MMRDQRVEMMATMLTLVGCTSAPSGTVIQVSHGQEGIGFDDLRYSATLHRVLVPAGRTGAIALINPDSGSTNLIPGFSTTGAYDGGHDFGVTSVDEGNAFLYATDRSTLKLHAIDPVLGSIVSSVGLASGPDYVRYVTSTGEVWVTEPGSAQIEVFAVSADNPPQLTSVAFIPVNNGPESLVIDVARGRAYTHRWQVSTVAIDVKSRQVIAEWPNGCVSSRGIELDAKSGFVFVACSEGTASVLDPGNNGKMISSLAKGTGYDVVGFNPLLRHLYLAGGACSCLTTLGVSASGQLTFLQRTAAPNDTHCVTADDIGNAWVCEPNHGSVIRTHDSNPAVQ